MKILITGKNSFVGSGFKKYSIYKDIEEISLIENKPEDIDFSRYDVLLHLAAIVHQKKKIPEQVYYEVNHDLCIRTAKCAKEAGVRHFVFLSTVKVYGESAGVERRDETSPCFPDDAYGKSKYDAEKSLRLLEDQNFIVSVIRPPVVYGEGVKANIHSLIKLIDNIRILPFAQTNNKRNFLYVGNLVGYIDSIIEMRASGIYLALDDKPLSTTELIKMISDELGKKTLLLPLPDFFVKFGVKIFPGLFGRLFGSLEFENSKTIDKLNFQFPYSTREGIRKTVTAYKNNS